MAHGGWNDPTWAALYSPTAHGNGAQPVPSQAPAPDPASHYTDILRGAAATGHTVNLSDMPGYQTNLQGPYHAWANL